MPDLRVILIDDNDIDLYFHDKLLKYQGISSFILPFNGVQPALEFLSSNLSLPEFPPTLILLDIQMPELDGFDFLKLFESFPEKMKDQCHIVMVSSSMDFGDI
ncbi:MAG: response regulator, partial [Chitinophagaceae bacterium]